MVHQCARFTTDPKQEHAQALRWLGRYLKATRNRGTILKPAEGKDMEVYVDADFSGNWHVRWMPNTVEITATNRSSTESEYTGLSYALRDAIPIKYGIAKRNEGTKIPHSISDSGSPLQDL
jgi:hypothetical protein